MATPSVATTQFHRLVNQLDSADMTTQYQAARSLKTGYSLSQYSRVEAIVHDILGIPTHRKVVPAMRTVRTADSSLTSVIF